MHCNRMWQGPYSLCQSTGTACLPNKTRTCTHALLKASTVAAMSFVTLCFGHLLCRSVRWVRERACVRVCARPSCLTFQCISIKPTRALSVNMRAAGASAWMHCHSTTYLFCHSGSQTENKSWFKHFSKHHNVNCPDIIYNSVTLYLWLKV